MTLTKREQIISLGVGAALVVILGYSYVVSPYLESRKKLVTAIKSETIKYEVETTLLNNRKKVADDWKALTAGPLKTDPAQAASKTSDAFFDWERSSRFALQALKPDRALQKGDFQQIRFQVSGAGSLYSIARFLWFVETTDLPLQIDDIRINARKEGTDDLNLTLSATTLVFSPPPTTKPVKKPQPSGDNL